MLPTKYRLPASDIPETLRRGKQFGAPPLQLICRHNQLPFSRFAIIVSSSVSKHATVRNRTKRLIREALRISLPTVAQNHDGVFLAKKPILTLQSALIPLQNLLRASHMSL